MNTLTEIEIAVDALSTPQKQQLIQFLLERLNKPAPTQRQLPAHSVLDIPPVPLGRILRPLTADDDILGEMLAGRS